MFWSDSTIALHWINTPPNTLKTFVNHRVPEIQEIAPFKHWRHVASEQNPADLISRGVTPAEFLQSSIWSHGPEWLHQSEDHWPRNVLDNIEIPERKEIVILTASVNESESLRKYSSLQKLKRVVAYCLRFVNNSLRKKKLGRRKGSTIGCGIRSGTDANN
ncbi:hypothetical protein KPH14_012709 [Odynerus spinipes]|uniref:Uncharacterized protein n=1 Tax=Odynerus spinipes TaxID=1348599 RepID=A0AAD9RE04_9HYME|nr:hypothetical protein KPH14_012709 [Odynerus spinipes]